jgi:hypothetical protein
MWVAAIQYISPKRIGKENPSVIFHSSPVSMSGWFIFALVGSRHYKYSLLLPKRVE